MGAKRKLILPGILFGAVVLTGMVFATTAFNNGKTLDAALGFLVALVMGHLPIST